MKEASTSFYVDDHVGGAPSVQEALDLQKKLAERMKAGGFTLHKWKSKSVVMKTISSLDNDRDEETYAKQQVGTTSNQAKVLGIKWNPEEDSLYLDISCIPDEEGTVTRRSILSIVSKVYDPLVIIGPATISGRVIFQEACKETKEWGCELNKPIQERWKKWKRGVMQMKEIQIQGCVISANVNETKYNLHTFADASKEAYCATVYLLCKLQNQVSSNIIAAKTRLPPLRKDMSIPRLELTAARIAAKLTVTVKKAFSNIPNSPFLGFTLYGVVTYKLTSRRLLLINCV